MLEYGGNTVENTLGTISIRVNEEKTQQYKSRQIQDKHKQDKQNSHYIPVAVFVLPPHAYRHWSKESNRLSLPPQPV